MIGISFNLPFQEQLEFFRSKGYELSPNSWRDVWKDTHARAFTVAKVTSMDVLKDIRRALDEAMESGETLDNFKSGLRDTLTRKGWLAPEGERAMVVMPDGTARKRLTGWRLDTIFKTNSQAAYSAGRYKQQQELKRLRPYLMYVAVMDASTRPEHAAMNGRVWHQDHPVWNTWTPPNGFNCRCYTRTLSARQMERMGLEEETRGVDYKPEEGFDYNPGEAGLAAWQPDFAKYSAREQKLLKQALAELRYEPAESLASAEEKTQRRFGVENVNYSDNPIWGKAWATEAERLEHFNEITEEWHRLSVLYPELPKSVDVLHIVDTNVGLAITRAKANLGQAVQLAAPRPRTVEEISRARRSERLLGSRIFTEREEYWRKDGMRHELAHTLTTREISAKWESWARTSFADDIERSMWMQRNVSKYAADKGLYEEIAEAASLVTSDRYIAGTLPLEVENIIYEMFGG